MKRLVILSCLTLVSLVCVHAQPYPYMEVRGYAEQKVMPDILNVVVTFGESKEFLGKQNIEDLEQKVIKVLRNHGLDIKNDVSVKESTSREEEGRVYIRKTIAFTLDNYEKYYAMVRDMDFKGIQSVRIASSKYSKEAEVKMSLLSKAMKHARDVAAAILQDSGASVGKLIYINANSIRIFPEQKTNSYIVVGYGTMKKSDEYIDRPSEITLSVDMTVYFSISYPEEK